VGDTRPLACRLTSRERLLLSLLRFTEGTQMISLSICLIYSSYSCSASLPLIPSERRIISIRREVPYFPEQLVLLSLRGKIMLHPAQI
jgi:hypothetical protein